jgi:hypothetical protein
VKKTLLLVLGLLGIGSAAFSADDSLSPHRSLKDDVFVVETDESSDSDALNRISGNIDLGFSAPEQSYNSSDHYRPGPFGRSDEMDEKDQHY